MLAILAARAAEGETATWMRAPHETVLQDRLKGDGTTLQDIWEKSSLAATHEMIRTSTHYKNQH